jgi:uncharacterized protein
MIPDLKGREERVGVRSTCLRKVSVFAAVVRNGLTGIVALAMLALLSVDSATAGGLADGRAALGRGDYGEAVAILLPLAQRGDPRAQAMVGFLYAQGRGLPQNYRKAAHWYRRASEQGDATGQYMLGLMYDKGHGVPRDFVQAYKWLNLAVARAPERERQYWARIRDAVGSKLSMAELSRAQELALRWTRQR